MCGLTGFFEASLRHDEGALRCAVMRMTDTIVHRGPDDGGVWVDARAGIALGSRRLAIIDLSPEGHQPMVSASGRYVIAFNGEIYNYRSLREELQTIESGNAPTFRGHSDTEVLLAAIERWGLDRAIKRTIGMFAFALWDRVERRLHLGRDRIGEKPLYYGWSNQTFLFGSELKALRAHHDFDRDVDRGALALYLRYGYVPVPFSIYSGICKLPAGTTLTLDPALPGFMPEPVPYWSARNVAENGVAAPWTESEDAARDHLDQLLRDAIRQQMIADVPLGAFLSGGLDSSTVVALMQAQHSRPVRTFTIGFDEAGYNEAAHAKDVAHHLGTDHTELYVTPSEAMSVIPKLPALFDEPFADSSQIPTFLVSQLARRHVTVSLSGDGGDELFGGYNRYSWGRKIWRGIGWAPTSVRQVASQGLTSVSPDGWDRVFETMRLDVPFKFWQGRFGRSVHKLARILAVESPEAMYRLLVSNWKDPEQVAIGAVEPAALFTDADGSALGNLTQRMMFMDLVTYLPDDILVKVDRASMGVSLEARAPFLDHRVVEFAWRLPPPMKVRNGQGKWLLRQVLYQYVPQHLVDRPKAGFAAPVALWLRGPLRAWADELLDEQRLREEGFFDPAPIRSLWDDHLAGRRDGHALLWTVLMFQAWLEDSQVQTEAPTTHLLVS